MKFEEMGLSEKTLTALESLNFLEPTEVQEKTIPPLLAGDELIVRSQTGTGKTAAFGIALIEQIIKSPDRKGLVLAPTRELALQITKDLRAIGINHGMRVYAIYGGEGIEHQIKSLRSGFDIIVATPGRLLDHYARRTVNLASFNVIVLDEADRMLDMGFRHDIDSILTKVSKQRQMMLFSATVDSAIRSIAHKYMLEPPLIEVGELAKTESIAETIIKLTRKEKFDKLKQLLHQEPESRIIIFVSTQRAAEFVGKNLQRHNIIATYLHGGLTQSKREQIVRRFSEGSFRILVATDIASRGLHIEDVAHIINYDEARDAETHVHRVGRTGRMGNKGRATTFIETDKHLYPAPSFGGRSRGHSRNQPRGPRRIDSRERSSSQQRSYSHGYSRSPERSHSRDNSRGPQRDYSRDHSQTRSESSNRHSSRGHSRGSGSNYSSSSHSRGSSSNYSSGHSPSHYGRARKPFKRKFRQHYY